MNNAMIEQVGPPFEIYNFPKTEFVAHFVGTLNTVQAQVKDAAAGRLLLEGQEIVAAQSLVGVKSGDTVTVALRPERLSFASEVQKANRLDCTVETITFLGSIVRITLKIGSTSFYMDTFNNPFLALPEIGQVVQITCSADAILVLNQPAAVMA
jgi:putative spermidine/putrescine transport system ATP-binding protein